jgi:hypothetical protein
VLCGGHISTMSSCSCAYFDLWILCRFVSLFYPHTRPQVPFLHFSFVWRIIWSAMLVSSRRGDTICVSNHNGTLVRRLGQKRTLARLRRRSQARRHPKRRPSLHPRSPPRRTVLSILPHSCLFTWWYWCLLLRCGRCLALSFDFWRQKSPAGR